MTYTEILSRLRKEGFRVKSRETTDGARKAWLEFSPLSTPRKEWLDHAEKAIGALKGDGYRVEYQEPEEYGYDHPALFVVVIK